MRLLRLHEVAAMLVVVALDLAVLDRQQPAQTRCVHEQVADRTLLVASELVRMVVVVGGDLVVGNRDLTEQGLVADLDGVEVGHLASSAHALLDLGVRHVDALLDQVAQLAQEQVLLELRLEQRSRHLVGRQDALVRGLADEAARLPLERGVREDLVLELLVRHPQAQLLGLVQLEGPLDELLGRLAGEVELLADLFPLAPVEVTVLLLAAPHLVEELALADHPVADLHRVVAGRTGTLASRAPVDEHEQDEDRHHGPEDDLEVFELVAQPLERHSRPPEDTPPTGGYVSKVAKCIGASGGAQPSQPRRLAAMRLTPGSASDLVRLPLPGWHVTVAAGGYPLCRGALRSTGSSFESTVSAEPRHSG